jgi:hypothetical protein
LKRWDEVDADIKRFLNHFLPFLQEDSVPEGVVNEVSALVDVIRELAPQDRERVYAGLDQWTELVRRQVEKQ